MLFIDLWQLSNQGWCMLFVLQIVIQNTCLMLFIILQKQFKPKNISQAPAQNKGSSSQETACTLTNGTSASVPKDSQLIPQNLQEQFTAEGTQKSVHDRIRVPVSYEDLLGEDPKDD